MVGNLSYIVVNLIELMLGSVLHVCVVHILLVDEYDFLTLCLDSGYGQPGAQQR